MARRGSLGSNLQGVSQQPARVRGDGQVTEQINMISDVVQGLTSRPASVQDSRVVGPAGLEFDGVMLNGVKYTVGYDTGTLVVWGVDGTVYPVVYEDAAAQAYLGPDMRFYVYDGSVYCTNTKVVALASTSIDTAAVALNQGIVSCLGGQYSRTYTVTLTYSGGSVATGTYTVPDGTATGDAAKAASSYIIGQLNTNLSGHANFTAQSTTAVADDVLLVTCSNDTFKMTVADGANNTVLRVHVDSASKIEDLARFAPHGTLVKVVGEPDIADDFYMRFKADDETVVGNSFGVHGVWYEWVDASEPTALDLTTMPHVLFRIGGSFYFERNAWQPRRVGDSKSNPWPSFVGSTINGLRGFQGRLSMIAGPNWIASRTNIPSDFFVKSIIAQSVSDPVDTTATTEGAANLEWIVSFDRDLLLMSENRQYIITGSVASTPEKPNMLETTDFEMAGKAAPSSTGRTVLFPFTSGKYAGVKEFFSSDYIATNGANNITEAQDRYIVGDITRLTSSTNFSTVLCSTDNATHSNTVWVYKFLWDGDKKAQSAWYKWEFPYDVVYTGFDNATVHIIMRTAYAGVTTYVLTSLDLGLPINVVAGFHVCLDLQTTHIASAAFSVTLDHTAASFMQSTGCAYEGNAVNSTTETDNLDGTWTYTFDEFTVPAGAELVCGIKYAASVTPTMPAIRDRNGRVVSSSKLIVNAFTVALDESGVCSALLTSQYRAPRTFDNAAIIMVGDPLDTAQTGVRSMEFTVPWGERTDWSELTLQSTDIRPMTILEIEWEGQVLIGGR